MDVADACLFTQVPRQKGKEGAVRHGGGNLVVWGLSCALVLLLCLVFGPCFSEMGGKTNTWLVTKLALNVLHVSVLQLLCGSLPLLFLLELERAL